MRSETTPRAVLAFARAYQDAGRSVQTALSELLSGRDPELLVADGDLHPNDVDRAVSFLRRWQDALGLEDRELAEIERATA